MKKTLYPRYCPRGKRKRNLLPQVWNEGEGGGYKVTYPGAQFINPFTPQMGNGRQSRPHGFLDDAAQERARACLSEIRERWTELYPRPNSRQRDELKRLYQLERGYTVPEGDVIFDWHSRIGQKRIGE